MTAARRFRLIDNLTGEPVVLDFDTLCAGYSRHDDGTYIDVQMLDDAGLSTLMCLRTDELMVVPV